MPKGKSIESGETKMKTLSKALERKVFEIAKKEVYGLDKRGNLNGESYQGADSEGEGNRLNEHVRCKSSPVLCLPDGPLRTGQLP